MKTTENLQKSLAWMSAGEKVITLPGFNISDVLNSLDASFFGQDNGLEITTGGEIRRFERAGRYGSLDKTIDATEVKPVAPEEAYFLTQVILNTLNTQPDQFHNMFDIPGLETEGWDKLANIAQYLIYNGWIEPKAIEERLLVKLTIEGKIYLRNNNAWS